MHVAAVRGVGPVELLDLPLDSFVVPRGPHGDPRPTPLVVRARHGPPALVLEVLVEDRVPASAVDARAQARDLAQVAVQDCRRAVGEAREVGPRAHGRKVAGGRRTA